MPTLLLLGVLLAPALARAHVQASPASASFEPESPSPDDLMMNTTFGFIFSHDAGASWRWTCHEQIIGGSTFTPNISRNPDGTPFVRVPLGLAIDPSKPLWRSLDGGCDWTPIASLASSGVLTVVFDETGARAIAAGTDGAAVNGLAWLSSDGGATFATPMLASPGEDFVSAAFAASDPLRMYVSAIHPSSSTSSVWRSDDGGASWNEYIVPVAAQTTVRLLAVSPTDANVVWIRNDAAADHLMLSTNGAVSFSTVFTVPGDITGFALTPNGTKWVAALVSNGVFASVGGGPFAQLPGAPSPQGNLSTLAARGNTVYVTANFLTDPFAAATTTDGAVWTTAMSFARIEGPVSCMAGSMSATVCDALWPTVDAKIHPTPAPTSTPITTPTPPASPGKDCRCDAASGAAPPGSLLPALALAALAIARRARAR